MRKKRKYYYKLPQVTKILDTEIIDEQNYKGKWKLYFTCLNQDEGRWKDYYKMLFHQSLQNNGGTYYLAYIKFFVDDSGHLYAIEAGKSNSWNCDLKFEVGEDKGQAEKELAHMKEEGRNVEWCQTLVLVIGTDGDTPADEKKAYKIESSLQRRFGLCST